MSEENQAQEPQTIDVNRLNGQLKALEDQRNAAQNEIVNLRGELTVAAAGIEKQNELIEQLQAVAAEHDECGESDNEE